ncbi:response regulator [Clostridium akagii]|uniref:response regulator n=1 Tax=Clostridium akagii TaxID=91623 RepID=UPI00047D748A|nr:response regulator [Clostridium akagii]
MKKNILFVDDEKQILRAIKRLFMDYDYNIFLAESGNEALEILKNNSINIMVTDMRMPNMNGYSLLEAAKALYPNTLRLILSGYTDEKQIFDAIQNNLAKVYIFKPWDNNNFVNLINQISEFEDIRKEKRVLDIIDKIDVLPTLPYMYSRLCSLINEDATLEKITECITEDPSVSAQILHIANSAFYSINVGSIKQAISFLGFNNIKNIVLVSNVFDIKGDMGKLKIDVLWSHAVMTNKILHLIYRELLNKKIPEYCSTAGLLHDIGKILEIQYFKKECFEILDLIEQNPNESPLDFERQVLNVTHAELGGYLLDWWGVPHSIIEVAMFHHEPLDERVVNKELVCAAHIANYYSWKLLKIKTFMDFNVGTLDYLGITEKACEDLIGKIHE